MNYIAIVCWMLFGSVLRLCAQTCGATYITEFQYDLKKRTNWCNLLRLDAYVPIATKGILEFASIHVYKTRPERIINDLQTFSNIEEDNLPCAIAVLGYTRLVGNVTLFAGIRNLNEDYFTTPCMSLFTNSSCGIFPTLSANYPIANYPLAALCLDYKMTLGRFGIESSLYNGKGYNGWSKGKHPFIFNPRKDGVFSITEINYQTEYGKWFGGFSLHTNGDMPDVAGECKTREREKKVSPKMTFAWWGYAERKLWSRVRQEVNLLVQYTRTSSVFSECRNYMGAGVTWIHAPGGQKRHEAGLFLSAAQFKSCNEVAGEVTYRYSFNRDTYIQPAIHLIKNGGGLHEVFLIRMGYVLNGGRVR